MSNTVEQYAEEKQRLVDAVIEEIKVDIANGDVTAIDELLMFLPVERLKGYLPFEAAAYEEDLLARYPDAVAQVEVLKKDFL